MGLMAWYSGAMLNKTILCQFILDAIFSQNGRTAQTVMQCSVHIELVFLIYTYAWW